MWARAGSSSSTIRRAGKNTAVKKKQCRLDPTDYHCAND